MKIDIKGKNERNEEKESMKKIQKNGKKIHEKKKNNAEKASLKNREKYEKKNEVRQRRINEENISS